jgi:hypothetical protein
MFRLRLLPALSVLVALSTPAAAQSSSAPSSQSPKARCEQLIDFFDYYTNSRREHSDGHRNSTRIGAEIDCDRGKYDEGIAAMEKLLRNKKYELPAAGPG